MSAEDSTRATSGEAFELPLQRSPWDRVFIQPEEEGHGVWVYANESGRVRAAVRTGDTDAEPFARDGLGIVLWSRLYRRDSSPVSFTITPSWAEIISEGFGFGEQRPTRYLQYTNSNVPYAVLWFRVIVSAIGSPGKPGQSFNFAFQLEYSGTGRSIGVVRETLTVDRIPVPQHPFLAQFSETSLRERICVPVPEGVECFDRAIGKRYGTDEPYRRVIDFDALGIDIGEAYAISYTLATEAGAQVVGAEQYAEAILGDPLDASNFGIELNSSHEPVDLDQPLRCEGATASDRFQPEGTAAVVDTLTGLVWQRCSEGTTLDDQGTTDLSDDLCEARDPLYSDWQAALQASAAASYDSADWRLPNLKELETLTELSCEAPAQNTAVFPPTPAGERFFWTSSPGRDDNTGWTIDFSFGQLRQRPRDSDAASRLVRHAAAPQLVQTPAVELGDATALEGDDTGGTLRFPVRIRPAATEAIELTVETGAGSAIAGEDYEAPPSTFTIPAGATTAELTLSLVGDGDSEPDETVLVSLASADPVHLARPNARGVVRNDDAVLSIGPARASESEAALVFPVTLSAPAKVATQLSYETDPGTAAPTQDFQSTSGVLDIPIGATTAQIEVPLVDDAVNENEESLQLNVSGTSLIGEVSVLGLIFDDDGPRSYAAVNDTTVTYCASENNSILPCPQADLPRQDGDLGADLGAPDGDGLAGLSFTKRDAAGAVLADQSLPFAIEPYACVDDEVTGLTWEVKADDVANFRHWDYRFSWYDSDGVNSGADAGSVDGGTCLAGQTCDTEAYVTAVNAAALCGHSDWRLPSIDELYSLSVLTNEGRRGLDFAFFPHNYSTNGTGTEGFSFWSGTPFAGSSLTQDEEPLAWHLQMQVPDPEMGLGEKREARRVRLVR